mgnify:CR=1 FL=1
MRGTILRSHMVSLKGLSDKEAAELVPPGTIYLAYCGSVAHGTYKPGPHADKDLRGACVGSSDVYFGLSNFEQKETMKPGWDSVVYEVRKFIRLLVQQNPSALEAIWVEPHHRIIVTPAGQLILDNRSLFVTKSAHRHFCGYAFSQMRKMEAKETTGHLGAKRKELVEKYGWDVKQGSHLLRILRMGIEYLNDGVLNVDRGLAGDASMLLAVKNGEWPLEKVKAEAERLFKLADEAYYRSKLPERLNMDVVNELCKTVVCEGLKGQGEL